MSSSQKLKEELSWCFNLILRVQGAFSPESKQKWEFQIQSIRCFFSHCMLVVRTGTGCLEKKTDAWESESLTSQPVMGGRMPGCGGLGSPVWGSDSASWRMVKCLLVTRWLTTWFSGARAAEQVFPACGLFLLVLGTNPRWTWVLGLPLSGVFLCSPADSLMLPQVLRYWHVDQELRASCNSSSLNELLQERKQISGYSKK